MKQRNKSGTGRRAWREGAETREGKVKASRRPAGGPQDGPFLPPVHTNILVDRCGLRSRRHDSPPAFHSLSTRQIEVRVLASTPLLVV